MKRIGILLDNLKIKSWQNKIVEFIQNHPQLSLEIVIVNNNKSSLNSSANLYRLFQALDRKYFKVASDAFAIEDLVISHSIPVLYITGEETRFSYRFSDGDVQEIQDLNLDLLIRFGFGILKGDILKAAKYGIWSLHHGDNKINRGGPPGFWEVVNGEEITGATLQILSSDLDGGRVIGKAFSKTNFTSFNRNKNEVFWSGVELFISFLDKLAKENLNLENLSTPGKSQFYSYPLYKDPQNFTALKIHLRFWIRRINEAFREFSQPPQWYLIYKLSKNNKSETSIFRYKKLIPPKGYDWADPFVIEYNKEYYVFFEDLHIKSGKGHISYFRFNFSGDLLHEIPVKVLEEEYHLSYPFIFHEKDNFYMLPESANSGELWLYECEIFPNKWVKKHRIFKDKPFYDATLLKHNNIWYLFGTEKVINESSRDQYLFIYYTVDIFKDDWIIHPKSPVYRDVRGARPAGRIFEQDGKLIRPSQIGAPKYGYGIKFNEILELSPKVFKEKETDEILPNWEKNLVATHTFNSVGGFSIMDVQGFIKR